MSDARKSVPRERRPDAGWAGEWGGASDLQISFDGVYALRKIQQPECKRAASRFARGHPIQGTAGHAGISTVFRAMYRLCVSCANLKLLHTYWQPERVLLTR